MKTNAIRTRSLQVLTGMTLDVAESPVDVARGADTLAWDKTFPQSDKVKAIPCDQLESFFTEHLKSK